METFTQPKNFVDNPLYVAQRQACVARLDIHSIDPPIIEIIGGFSKLAYCFTLQSCYGHFLHCGQRNPYNTDALAISDSVAIVEYRIAYIAFCIEKSALGKKLFQDLAGIRTIDPEYIQFGCAEWFWERQINSFTLQVVPIRHLKKDKVRVTYQEALHIQKIRNQFFDRLEALLHQRLDAQ